MESVFSQSKYALNVLGEIGLMNSKPIDSPLDPNTKLLPSLGEPLPDTGNREDLLEN